jgi:hypothetical protein
MNGSFQIGFLMDDDYFYDDWDGSAYYLIRTIPPGGNLTIAPDAGKRGEEGEGGGHRERG